MAKGRSNGVIAASIFVTKRAVDKHVAGIFTKLNLPVSSADHLRVPAVLAYLGLWQRTVLASAGTHTSNGDDS